MVVSSHVVCINFSVTYKLSGLCLGVPHESCPVEQCWLPTTFQRLAFEGIDLIRGYRSRGQSDTLESFWIHCRLLLACCWHSLDSRPDDNHGSHSHVTIAASGLGATVALFACVN
jgi:hypothetical protein